jgi:hypothetical protein
MKTFDHEEYAKQLEMSLNRARDRFKKLKYLQEAYDQEVFYALNIAKNHITWLWDMLEGDPACTLRRENSQVIFDIVKQAYDAVSTRLKK